MNQDRGKWKPREAELSSVKKQVLQTHFAENENIPKIVVKITVAQIDYVYAGFAAFGVLKPHFSRK